MRTWMQEARSKKGLTQSQVAEAIGEQRAYYGMIETGSRGMNLSATLLMKIATALDIDIGKAMQAETDYKAQKAKDAAEAKRSTA